MKKSKVFSIIVFAVFLARPAEISASCPLSKEFAINGQDITRSELSPKTIDATSVMNCEAYSMSCAYAIRSCMGPPNHTTPGNCNPNAWGQSGCQVRNDVDHGTSCSVPDGPIHNFSPNPQTLSDALSPLASHIAAGNANHWGQPASVQMILGEWRHCFAYKMFDMPDLLVESERDNPDSKECGSVIDCRNQTLQQVIPVDGTNLNLVYSSSAITNRTHPSYTATMVVPTINGMSFPHAGGDRWKLKKVRAKLTVAGRVYQEEKSADDFYSPWTVAFTWDGLDSASNPAGASSSRAEAEYIFVQGPVPGTPDYTLRIKVDSVMGYNVSLLASQELAAGWRISEYHRYDPETGELHLGNGSIIGAKNGYSRALVGGFYDVPSEDRSLVFRFNSSGLHTKTIDALTGVTLLTFNHTSSKLSSILDLDGLTTAINRNGSGEVTSIVSPYGFTTTLAYDFNGHLSSITNNSSETTSFTYHSGGNAGLMATMTDPMSQTKSYVFDANGKLQNTTDRRGNTRVYDKTESLTTYSFTKTITSTSPMSRVTSYQTYSDHMSGKIFTDIHPSGKEESRTTDNDGTRIYYSDNWGYSGTQLFEQDSRFPDRSRMSSTQLAISSGGSQEIFESYVYDSTVPTQVNEKTTTVQYNGDSSWFTTTHYDRSNSTITRTSPMSRLNVDTLDTKGRVITSQSGGLNPVNYTYNSSGQLTQVSQGSRATSYGYNSDGLLSTITNALSEVTSLQYDSSGRVSSVTDGNNKTSAFGYNDNGDMISITNASLNSYGIGFDANQNLNAHVDPVIGGVAYNYGYTYNLDNQRTQSSMADGTFVNRTYNSQGLLSGLTGTGVNRTYSYSSEGRLNSITSPSSRVLSFQYNSDLTGMTWAGGGIAGSVAYTWGSFNTLTSIAVNNSSYIDMTYNKDLQLTDAASVTYGYNSTSGLLESVMTGPLVSGHVYSNFGELSSSSNYYNTTNIVGFSYTRDALGRISSQTRTTPSLSQTTSYTYDAAGQLLSETSGSTTKTYTYSDTGNRFTSGGSEVYDSQDRLVSDSQWAYTYNKNGYLSRKDHVSNGSYVTYTYDVLGNLTAVIYSNGTRVDYVVDGMNRRIQRKLNNVFSANFIFLDDLRPIAQLNSNGSIKSTFVYGSKLNVPDLMIQGSVRYRIISDHLGSPTHVVRESNGQVVQVLTYDTWGKVLTDSNPGFQPFGFAGGIYDVTTGLLRFGARDYDPAIGRWLDNDPVRHDGGLNLYQYSYNDPVNLIDSTGLRPDNEAYWPAPDGAVEPDPRGVILGAGIAFGGGAIVIGGIEVGSAAVAAAVARAKPWSGSVRGGELVLKKGGETQCRINPLGDSGSKNPFGRYPHYHTRGKKMPNGETAPGEGIGRHRPWEKKSTDKSFWDRF